MPLTILLLALLISLGQLADVFVSDEDDVRLKNRLADFFVSVKAGDWTLLYRSPARAVLRLLDRVFGPKLLSWRYPMSAAALSLTLTALFFCASMLWSWLHVLLTERNCQVPGFSQFLEIPGYMNSFLIDMALVNFLFDLGAWALARFVLRIVAESRGIASLAALLFMPLLAAGMLWSLYALYLPLAIGAEARGLGIPFGTAAFDQILQANLASVVTLFTRPDYLFVIRCSPDALNRYAAPDHPIFSISFVKTMQIVATETMIPFILFLVSCLFGMLIYVLQPFVKRPLAFLIDRVAGSKKHVLATLGAILGVVSAVIAAFVTYRKN
jgi:hypothetical protein